MGSSRKGIFTLIGLLAVGFAAVTTTLVINGTGVFGTMNDDFVIIFTKAIVDGWDKSSEVISSDGKTITYTTKELTLIGDESVLDFTVKNSSTHYDARVSIECIGGENFGTFYKIDKEFAEIVPAQSTEDGKVLVSVIKNSTEPIEEEFTCTLIFDAVERETIADVPSTCDPVTTCNEVGDACWTDSDCSGDKNFGDLVTLGTEDNSIEKFYILTHDEENTRMISMYNLYVGGEYDTEWISYDNPTGIQDSTMRGFVSEETISRGTTVFSESGNTYTGSIVEGYVNSYKDYLTEILEFDVSATLVTKEELETFGCSSEDKTCARASEFLYSTSYWTGSTSDSSGVIRVTAGGPFEASNYNDGYEYGVRPVVTVDNDLFVKTIPVCTLENPTVECYEKKEVCWTDVDCSEHKNLADIITLTKAGATKESFYIMTANDTNITMMSMYNLYVGTEDGKYYENPTGLQDPLMLGYVDRYTTVHGGEYFSNAEQKGTNYSSYAGSIVEGHVNNYSSYIANTLGRPNTATIISKDELEAYGCSFDDYTCVGAPAFFYSTSYWTRSAFNTDMVWAIYYGGSMTFAEAPDFKDIFGVRPVITISASFN